MRRLPLRLGKLGSLLLALLIVGIAFIGGSALYDSLFTRKPSEAQITAGIRATLPAMYGRFSVARNEQLPSSSGEPKARSVPLSPKNILLKAANFEEEAIKRGDDPAQFADALARRKKLDQPSAPPIPNDQPLKNLYAVASSPFESFAVEVSFRAEKVARNWSLHDCWMIWRGFRDWSFPEVKWPDLPAAVATLRERDELGSSPVILGKETDAWFRSYIERRKTFIKAVHEQENRSVDQVIQDAVRFWVERSLTPSDVFVVKTVTPVRSNPPKAGSTITDVSEASVVIEQHAELFRAGDVDALRSELAPLHDRMEQTKKLATDFLGSSNLTGPSAPAVYHSASPPRTEYKGSVVFEVKTSSPTSIENIRWTEEPKWPAGPTVSHRECKPDAIFHSTDSKLRTVTRYQEEVEAYIKRVEESIAALEARWGKDREAWRMALRALNAHGGRELIVQQSGFIELISGTRVATQGKEIPLTGSRKILMPFRVREDLGFTGLLVVDTQTETLNERGFWRTAEGVMRLEDLTTVNQVTFQRQMAFTRHILWHLAAEGIEKQTLIRGADPNTLIISTGRSDFPDVTITLDPEKGLITSARCETVNAAASKRFEARYTNFAPFAGTIHPTKVSTFLDGKPKDTYVVTNWKPVPEIKPEDFRNPYSPGKPFRGNSGRPKHDVQLTNSTTIGTPIMICFDDEPDTVALASRGNRTIQLPEGEHIVNIVAWIPQASLRQTHRIEARAASITIRQRGEIIVSVDPKSNPPIRWEFR